MKKETIEKHYNFLVDLKESIQNNPNVTLNNIVVKHRVCRNIVAILKRLKAIKETPNGLIWDAGDIDEDLILLIHKNKILQMKKAKKDKIEHGLLYTKKKKSSYRPKQIAKRGARHFRVKPRKIIYFKIFGFDFVIKFPYKPNIKFKS